MFDTSGANKKKQACEIKSFPRGSLRINWLMDNLMLQLKQNRILRESIFEVRFVTTQIDEAVIILLYHKPLIADVWIPEAEKLSQVLNAKIVGRSRKTKLMLPEGEIITEVLNVNSNKYIYFQTEGAFSQPNAAVCQKMLEWAVDVTSNSHSHDLLELYCGGGTFTIALAANFRRVLATEMNKVSVSLANDAIKRNNVNNIDLVKLSSEEFTQAYENNRKFQRLELLKIDIKDYHLKTVFVDPPRCGLDMKTCQLLKSFDEIVYISCNPTTLVRDLSTLCQSHKIVRIASFDQFPYTHHLEVGVKLVKKTGEELLCSHENVPQGIEDHVLGKRVRGDNTEEDEDEECNSNKNV
jgi:tRNA (uracil-5-)-methyltransferase